MSAPRPPDVAAVILAGGRSRRMGRDKALLPVNGRTILDRTVGVLRELTDDIVIAGRDRGPEGVRYVPDAVPESGPLGGLVAGLRVVTAPLVLAVSCDLPYLNPTALRALLLAAGTRQAVVPRDEKGVHPLHAVYASSALAVAEDQLARGDLRLRNLLIRLDVCWFDVHDGEFARSLTNVNTPEDWACAIPS